MQPFNWGRFVTRININATEEKVYQAWATREGIESWFLRLSEFKTADDILRKADEFVQPGDSYLWKWHGWPDEMQETGTILECNGKNLFRFSFGNAGNCTVSVIKESGELILQLLQEDIPETDQGKHYWHLGCKTGWTFYLANIKSILEGGIDLRNKNELLKNMVNS